MVGGEQMDMYNETAKVAYELYEKNGFINDRDLDHWIEAEKIVIARLAEEEKKREKGKVQSEKKPATNVMARIAEEEKKKEGKKVKSEKKPATKTKKTVMKKTK